MKKTDGDNLFKFVHDYLKVYLPKQRKASPNTIRSYRKALDELFDYIKEKEDIPLWNVALGHLDADTILSFIEHLGTDCGCSDATLNSRLAAIRAFMDYAADRDVTLVDTLNALKKVSYKKPRNADIIDYMSMEAVTALARQADTHTAKGRRDGFFIMLMYDTGARVSEVLDIRLCDFQLGSVPKVTPHGKGKKTRSIPLMEKTVQHLEKYLSEFHSGLPISSDEPLFYSTTHGERHKLTARNMRYVLRAYGEKAGLECPEVPEKIFPHLLRHSRAMHLYQEGMDLTLVSQWLGHSQLETTQIYAHADTEQKRKAIAAATPPDNPLYSKLNSARYTVTDEETLKKLMGLR